MEPDVVKVEIDVSDCLLPELLFGMPFCGIIRVEPREGGGYVMVFVRVDP